MRGNRLVTDLGQDVVKFREEGFRYQTIYDKLLVKKYIVGRIVQKYKKNWYGGEIPSLWTAKHYGPKDRSRHPLLNSAKPSAAAPKTNWKRRKTTTFKFLCEL